MDLVYIVREGDNNDSLRYSLRATQNIPHDNVWISGYTPNWVRNVGSIPGNRLKYKWVNGPDNIRRAVEDERVSDPFILMNDDFFVMEPIQIDYVEYLSTCWRSGLREQYEGSRRRSEWKRALGMAYEALTARGIDNPKAFTLHMPLIVEKYKMNKVFEEFYSDDFKRVSPEIRSLYGNYWNMATDQLKDCKVYRREDRWEGRPLVSTCQASFMLGKIGDDIRERFPEPSPYE